MHPISSHLPKGCKRTSDLLPLRTKVRTPAQLPTFFLKNRFFCERFKSQILALFFLESQQSWLSENNVALLERIQSLHRQSSTSPRRPILCTRIYGGSVNGGRGDGVGTGSGGAHLVVKWGCGLCRCSCCLYMIQVVVLVSNDLYTCTHIISQIG